MILTLQPPQRRHPLLLIVVFASSLVRLLEVEDHFPVVRRLRAILAAREHEEKPYLICAPMGGVPASGFG